MQHYICAGDCGGESDRPGVCEHETCSKEGQSFISCDCDDGFHEKVLSINDELDIEKMDDEDEF